MKKITFTVLVTLLTGILTFSTAHAEKEYIYRLKWLFNASVAGDIYADVNGYFDRAGIKVKVKEGGLGKNAIKELELGQSDFGVASADQVIQALEKGAKVVVLAQIFQVNPMQWIYRADIPEMTRLADLKGKNIGITFGGNDEAIMNTLFAKGQVKKDDVKITSVRFDFTPFLTKKVDLWPVYINSQGVILKDRLAREGEDVRFINPADFGVNFVANSIITSTKMLDENPAVVKKFMEALTAGWVDAMDTQKEEASLKAIASRDKGNNDEIRKLQLTATRNLVMTTTFGYIDTDAWMQTEEIMLKQGLIRKAVRVESVLTGIRK